MLINYFRVALRKLSRNTSYTIINIIGLAVGVAACLLIFLVIHFETSFDNFHEKKDHIYRVVTVSKTSEGTNYLAGVPMPTAAALRMDYPELLTTSIFKSSGQINVLNTGTGALKKFDEDGIYFAEPQFFSIFDFAWLSGDKRTALTEPNAVVLTQDAAEKYFGNWKDAIGKTISYQNDHDLKVTGILKNMPANTDLSLNVVISFSTVKTTRYKNSLTDEGGIMGNNYCFVVLPDNVTHKQLTEDLDFFARKHKPIDHRGDRFMAQPLDAMHFDGRFGVFSGKIFSKELLTALSLVGLFLLIIACFNYINMATANAFTRSKEVGIRKVLGSDRKRLVFQFIGETFIITLFSVMLAVGIAEIALPFLGQLLEIRLNPAFLSDAVVILFLAGVIFSVALLSGFYPAIVLSGFNPITTLKNKIALGSSNSAMLRRGLVVLQFCIAQILIIGTLVIVSQMNYFKNYSLGFDKDAVINVPLPGDSVSHSRLNVFRNQLLSQPGVKDVSYSFASPSDNYYMDNYFKYNNSAVKTNFLTHFEWADAEYFKLYNMKFIAGGPYEDIDSLRGYVVNETLLKKLGVRDPKDAIGKYINIWDDKTKYAPIVGVIKDFNVSSLREEIPPVLMGSSADFFSTINIKLRPGNIMQSLTSIDKLWSNTFTNDVYEYQFLDKKIAGFYDQERRLSILYQLFAGIAIFISCLGLYGLVSFMAARRIKEVGIRKILGASVGDIIYLFSREFFVLILVAFAVAAPIGWYFMNNWLQAFANRIILGPGVFLLTVVASVLIAMFTVGYKAIWTALANPVKNLRSE